MEKILITGTGRCGTTFLIKLFSFLEFDTGFTKDNYKNYVFSNCNSGMELNIEDQHYILKNPQFIKNINNIIMNYKIKYIIIPIRDYNESAKSRQSHNFENGGLWNATNELEQVLFYNEIIANYTYIMTKYDIPTIFIDFDRMINNKEYLFNKLKNILDEKNISFELFSSIYDEVSITSKPKKF
jgi:hypothetical protein